MSDLSPPTAPRPNPFRGPLRAARRLLQMSLPAVLPPLRSLLRWRRATVLVYHDPSPETLDHHLCHLRAQGYTPIPLGRWIEAMTRGSVDGLPRRPLVVTMDDGWRGNARLPEVLRRHGCRATVFLCAGLVGTNRTVWDFVLPVKDDRLNAALKSVSNASRIEVMREMFAVTPETELPERRMLSLEEIHALQPDVDFQSHGVMHPPLPTCSPEELEDELAGSRRCLEVLLETPVQAFAYPYGEFGDRERQAVERAGYRVARSCRPGLAGIDDDRLALPSVAIEDDAELWQLERRLAWAEAMTMARLAHKLARRLAPTRRQEKKTPEFPLWRP